MAMILSKLWPESWEQTDGRTDGQTVAIIIPPPNFVCGGGKNWNINMMHKVIGLMVGIGSQFRQENGISTKV